MTLTQRTDTWFLTHTEGSMVSLHGVFWFNSKEEALKAASSLASSQPGMAFYVNRQHAALCASINIEHFDWDQKLDSNWGR